MNYLFGVVVVFLMVFHGGKGEDTPTNPMWPPEFVQLIAGQEFQMKLNFSYGNQELYIDANSYGRREQFYLSCRSQKEIHLYAGNPDVGRVCYNMSVKEVNAEQLCPITKYPFLTFVDSSLEYDGEAEFEGETIFIWIGGADEDGLCDPCTVYWETAQTNPLDRVPIAADYKVYHNPGGFAADPAGYYQYFESFSKQTRVIQPDVECHTPFPPLLISSNNKKQALPPLLEEEPIVIRSLADILPRLQQHASLAKQKKDSGPIFIFPNPIN